MRRSKTPFTVVIQAVPARAETVQQIANKFSPAQPVKIVMDEAGLGSYASFKQVLAQPIDGIRLHLQDDVYLAHNLEKYLPFIIAHMEDNDMQMVSLFAPKRKRIDAVMHEAEQLPVYMKCWDCIWLQAVLMTQRAVDILREAEMPGEKYDDRFLQDTMKQAKIPHYVHLPGLVQHNTMIDSTLGHAMSVRRTSQHYQPKFIQDNFRL